MKIFLTVVGILFILILIILLLPVKFIIRNDDENRFYFRVKFLWFSFGDSKKTKKGAHQKSGIEQLELESLKARVQRDGITETLTVAAKIIKTVFKRLERVIEHGRVNRFDFIVVCSAKDAAQTAIRYGSCCAIVYPLLGFINSIIKVNPKNRNIDVSCKYGDVSEVLRYNFIISVRIFYLLVAALGLLWDYIKLKRQAQQ